jgi:hypothetical protein
MIFTHLRPDLDALASAWLARRIRGHCDEVGFVSSAWIGPIPSGDLAVDIACGLKGRLDSETGRVSSAFRLILELPEAGPYREPLAALANVEAQDTTGRGPDVLTGHELPDSVRRNCLPALIEAARAAFGDDDRALFDWTARLFDGMLELHARREAEMKRADRAHWFGPVALVEGESAAELFRRGARAVVYSDGLNLGALRASGECFHLGRLLEPWLREQRAAAGWHFHPAGFIACHGSRKAPAERLPYVPAEAVGRFLARSIPPRTDSAAIPTNPGIPR